MLYLGSDHGGFRHKEALTDFLTHEGIEFDDLGPDTFDPDDDYPMIAGLVAEKVSRDSEHQGVLLCRSGQGVALVANKFPGIRAVTAWNPEVAAASREDDNSNILCLPADYVTLEEMEAIMRAWLAATFKTGPQYQRRLEEIADLEERHLQ